MSITAAKDDMEIFSYVQPVYYEIKISLHAVIKRIEKKLLDYIYPFLSQIQKSVSHSYCADDLQVCELRSDILLLW